MRDHAAAAVISLAHSAVMYWSCFVIDKQLKRLKNMKLLLSMGYIPVFTVLKYLVSGIYQRQDLKLKFVKISVQGPFKFKDNIITTSHTIFHRGSFCVAKSDHIISSLTVDVRFAYAHLHSRKWLANST